MTGAWRGGRNDGAALGRGVARCMAWVGAVSDRWAFGFQKRGSAGGVGWGGVMSWTRLGYRGQVVRGKRGVVN